ncbi:MAG: hypothetical protein ACRDS0_41480 [Pseudonocardiaceae bacterium]
MATLVDVGVLPESDLPDSYPYLPNPDSGLSTSLWNLLTGNSQMGIWGLLTGGLQTGSPLQDLVPGSDPLLSPGLDLATLLPGLDLSSALLGLPDALGLGLDPTLLLSPLDLLLGL